MSEEERRQRNVVNLARFLHDHLGLTPADIVSVFADINKKRSQT
jgi:hypothetical protein